MSIEEQLIEKGYKHFKPGPLDHEGITDMYQKRFDDKVGKKYFITIHKWRAWTHPYTGEVYRPTYEFNVQFSYCGKPINMTAFSGWELEEAEQKYEEIWQKCNFDYYEIFDGEDRRVSRASFMGG